MLFNIFRYLFPFQRYSSFQNMQIKDDVILTQQKFRSTKLYQKCLILSSKVLLNLPHNMSLTLLLLCQHSGFQTSSILKAFLISGHLWRSIFIVANGASSAWSSQHFALGRVRGFVICFLSWESITYWKQVGGDWKEWVAMGREYFIAVGVFSVELLACQVSMVFAANWPRLLYLYTWCNSGAPAARRVTKRSPILIRKKRKPMDEFFYGYHGQRYCSWARTHDGNDGDGNGVAQHGGHTPNNRLTHMQPWLTVFFFDIGHPSYDQLTPVKSRFPLTSITWSYRGLKFTADQVLVFDSIAGSCHVLDCLEAG